MKSWLTELLIIALMGAIFACTTTSHREQILARDFTESNAECMEKIWRLMRLRYECEDNPDFFVGVRACMKKNPDAVRFWAKETFKCPCE